MSHPNWDGRPPSAPNHPGQQPQPSYVSQTSPGYAAPPGAGPGLGRPPVPYEFARPTNALAGVSLGLGIAGLAVPLACFAAVVTGHLARSAIRRTGEDGDGLALAGLVLGYAMSAVYLLVIVIVFVVIAAVAASGSS